MLGRFCSFCCSARHLCDLALLQAVPTEPLIFNKFSNCICATGDTLPKDPETNELDYEVELAIVIGQTVPRRTSEADAGQYILGAIMCSLNLDTCMVQSIMPEMSISPKAN